LAPREAAKAWDPDAPPKTLRILAYEIRKVLKVRARPVAAGREWCGDVNRSTGLPCCYLARPGKSVCASHDPDRKRPSAPLPAAVENDVRLQSVLRLTADGWLLADRRSLKEEQRRLERDLELKAPLTPEEYMLAAQLLPSPDPATQARREAGLPGPNDGIGDAARMRALVAVLSRLFTTVDHGLEDGSDAAAPTKLGYVFAEAAERIGCNESWLRQQVAARAIPHRRIGSRVLFTEDDLRAILDGAAEVPTMDTRRRRGR
jgi:hypothetical protein